MNSKEFKEIFAKGLALIGLDANHGKPINLNAEQKEKLDEDFREGFAEQFEKKFNASLETEKELEAISEQLDAFMADDVDTNATTETAEESGENKLVDPEANENKSVKGKLKAIGNELTALRNEKQQLLANNLKLKKMAEPDNPETIAATPTQKIAHSATHLFASNNSWDAFEGRNWNKLAAGKTTAATDWSQTINIDKLNSDVQNYFRKDPKKLHNMMLDAFNVPKYWRLVSNVSDEYLHVTFSTGDITQGIKSKWLPKNKVKFSAQIGKVRDIQIDIEFQGHELKKMEKSYLNNFWNEGSDPYKMSFVLWLTQELLNKARKEDKITLGKGVYAPNISSEGGHFLNNFSGVIKLAIDARDKLYKSFKLGTPTHLNIDNYIKTMVESLPYETRNLPDLVFYISPTWLRSYNEARRRNQGRDIDYKGDTMTVDDFPNIELYPYDQLDGTDFMFITTKDNIYILTDKLGEDSVIQFVKSDARVIKGSGDYKLAAFIAVFGRELIGTYANTYENQLFFSNDVEVLTDVYVPVEANNATPSLKYHNSLAIGEENTTATNITGFTDIPSAGSKVYLKGNTDANFSTVKNGGVISLIDGDCVLTKDQLLVLFVKADGTFQELYREQLGIETVEEAKVVIDADTTVIDASAGTSFVTSSNTAATEITNIENALQGETYRIEGGSDTNASTISDGGNFKLTAAITLNAATYIDVYYNGKLFVELARG